MTTKRSRAVFLIGAMMWLAGIAHSEILTIYSDKRFTIPGTVTSASPFAQYNQGYVLITPPEGLTSFWSYQPNPSELRWDYSFTTAQNLTRFQSGEVRFWIYASTGAIRFQMKNSLNAILLDRPLDSLGWTLSNQNQWYLARIPLAGVSGLSDVKMPCAFLLAQGPTQFLVDYIRYVDSTSDIQFSVQNQPVGTNPPSSDIEWNLTYPIATPWQLAQQQIQLNVDSIYLSWGVQLYTDNTAADANPRFDTSVSTVGLPGSNPAGLVSTVLPSQRVIMAWKIQASSAVPTAADPNTGPGFGWLFMMDRATPAIPLENTAAFYDGITYALAKNQKGIHWGPADFQIGAENNPNYMFFEANFADTFISTYKTTKLILEYFQP